ncbi:MAG TPA: hypothetical protein PLN55_11525 [Burkholderiaceae bacterium]|nr:hypothetical protein [Burkholderiaceae bacterium]
MAPKFPGPAVRIGGAEYVLPKLSFGGFERAKTKIQAVVEQTIGDPIELQGAIVDVVLEALRRNYPELARETVLDALDWDTAVDLFHLTLRNSMPALPPGEPQAGSPSGASTGTAPSPT